MITSRNNTKPFTVIGGFLGAGKTTLLNRVLSESSGIRFAVLVNDFGAINIDQSLVRSHDGSTLNLSNGCICCSLADGFVNTMLDLMQRADSFDHIVVEASGVSEPQRIMDIALLDPELHPDAIVTLIDSLNFEQSISDPAISRVIEAQVECADLLVLNKQDLELVSLFTSKMTLLFLQGAVVEIGNEEQFSLMIECCGMLLNVVEKLGIS